MKTYKPSELPLNTVIEFENDEYIKTEAYYGVQWQPINCEDCSGTRSISVADEDEQIKEFKVISLPLEVAQYMAKVFSDAIEVDAREGVIDEAILMVTRSPNSWPMPSDWRPIPNYPNYEIRKDGWVRHAVTGDDIPKHSSAFGDKVHLFDEGQKRTMSYSVKKILEVTFK